MGDQVIRKRERGKEGESNKWGRGRRERRKMSPRSDSNAEVAERPLRPLSGTDAICHPSLFQREHRGW